MIQANTDQQRTALMALQPIPIFSNEDMESRDRRLLANMEFNADQAEYLISLMKSILGQIQYDIVPTSLEAMRLRLRDGCMDRIVENGRYYEDVGTATKFALAVKLIGEYFTEEFAKMNKQLAVLAQLPV